MYWRERLGVNKSEFLFIAGLRKASTLYKANFAKDYLRTSDVSA